MVEAAGRVVYNASVEANFSRDLYVLRLKKNIKNTWGTLFVSVSKMYSWMWRCSLFRGDQSVELGGRMMTSDGCKNNARHPTLTPI